MSFVGVFDFGAILGQLSHQPVDFAVFLVEDRNHRVLLLLRKALGKKCVDVIEAALEDLDLLLLDL